jgi:hypothetical protein
VLLVVVFPENYDEFQEKCDEFCVDPSSIDPSDAAKDCAFFNNKSFAS